jgi:phosphonate transport system substrate-binding protein
MSTPPLRFATFLAPSMFPVYQAIVDYVGQRLGCPTSLVVGESFAAFAAGEIDAGFICGLPYVDLAGQVPPAVVPLVAPVLQGPRYQGRPIYFSDVIVRRDSPFGSFTDLRGASWSYNDPDSHSGYNLTRYELARRGETRDYFGTVIAAGWHQESIRWVAEGQVDASAIDSQVLAIALRDDLALGAHLRVIATFGPSTIQPVVAAAWLPAALWEQIRAALLSMTDDPALRAGLATGFVERFVPVDDATYDDIRHMRTTAEAAGVLTLR